MRGKARGKRGVSYVLAVFIVTIITLAAAVALYGWAGGFLGSVAPIPSEAREEITIEAGVLLLDDVGGELEVGAEPANDTNPNIRYWHLCTANTGPVDVDVEAMYISDPETGSVLYHLSTTELKEEGYAIYRVNSGDWDTSTHMPKNGSVVDPIMFGPLHIEAGDSRCFEGSVAINITALNLTEDNWDTAEIWFNSTDKKFYYGNESTDDFEFFQGEGGAVFEPGKIYVIKLTTTGGAATSIAVKAAQAEA